MPLLIEILLILLKATIVMAFLLKLASITIWIERKGSALIQDRIGANRAAIFGWDLAGLFNTLVADPVKALFKEDFVPKGTSQLMHSMAPFLAVFPVIVSFAVVPFGPPLTIGEYVIPLQLAVLNVGVLYVFAMSSLSVYGVVLAGWVSNNKFSLLGGLRASAQMISYEITMGISLVGLFIIYQSLDFNQIVQYQTGTVLGFLPRWGIVLNPIAFFIFFAAVMAETKRVPFDLPESESEIVAGYLTEYSGMKFLLFWLGEFSEIVVASALLTLLFLGGWQLPYFDLMSVPAIKLSLFGTVFNFQIAPLIAPCVFGVKVFLLCVLQVVIRWTLPRFRYDQLMNMCWKLMFPLSLINLLITAVVVLSV